MNGWSIEYMLETADELQKKRRLDKYIEQAAIPENVKGIFGDRIIATLKTSAARFDAEYYTCMAAVKPNDPEGFDILLKRAGKAVSAGRIDASVPQLAVRWFGRNEFEAAGALLDPMAMGQLLDALMTINAAGYRDHARNPLVHKNPARALRIQLAAVIADWAVKPVEWSSYEPTIRGIIASLDPADQSAIAAWVANKPELAHLADVGGDLAAQGQFAFGGFLHYELAALIASEGAGGELAIANALDSANIYDSDDFSTKMEKGARVARRSYAGLNPIFQFRAVSRDRGLAIYEELWAEYEKTRTLATMNRYRNLYDLHSLRIAEKDRCNAQVRHMHGLHSNLGGGAGTGPEPKLAGNGLVKDIKHHKVPATAVPWRGSEVTYVGNLDAIVASMKAVLDTNRRIIAGVLSGAQGSITPEHYLYIIGYRGNSFVCADSDPGNEQAGGLPVAGVTYLYYDPAANRLSTAPTDAEFPINYTPTEARFQMNGPHRYQALTVSVLPSKRAP